MRLPENRDEVKISRERELSGGRTKPRQAIEMTDRLAPSDVENKTRKAGDPLECECPVCTRVKRMIEVSAPFEDIGKGEGLFVSEDGLGGPEDRPGASGPNLKEAVSIAPAKTSLHIRRRATDHAEEDMSDAKRRRLTIVAGIAWSG